MRFVAVWGHVGGAVHGLSCERRRTTVTVGPQVWVGIDVGKLSHHGCAVDATGKVVWTQKLANETACDRDGDRASAEDCRAGAVGDRLDQSDRLDADHGDPGYQRSGGLRAWPMVNTMTSAQYRNAASARFGDLLHSRIDRTSGLRTGLHSYLRRGPFHRDAPVRPTAIRSR